MKPLEILSYNIEFGKKFDDVVNWIARELLDPDIFCFQEFPEAKIPFFEKFLQERGYAFAYTPGIILRGIKIGELTAYKQTRLRFLESKDIALGNHLWERRHNAIKGQRSGLLTAYRYNEALFAVANVHLSVFSPHSMRYKQLRMVIEELERFSENALIIGDFNYTSLLGVKRLFRFMGEYDFVCVGERMITHKIFKRIPQQLDYVFQKGFAPQEISVLTVPHSDHLPLYMKLAVPAK
jgi:endonuclease/exonuclease/phosphatase (EEP) superfamily protein YafD